MIGYVTVGTNDLARAATFYDALFAELGATRLMDSERFILWGTSPKAPGLSAVEPHDGQPATVGNGVMVAIAVDAPAKVDAFHQKAMSLGAQDEGAPGPRGGSFYGGYFRDLDGNKLNVFCMV